MASASARERAILLLLASGRRHPVRQAADTLEPKFSVAVRAAFAVARKKLPDVEATVTALEAALRKVLPVLLSKALEAGGTAAAARLTGAAEVRAAARPKLRMQFNASDPRAIAWAKRHAAELVAEIAKTTRERLKAAVVAHQEGELSDREYRDQLEQAVGDEERAQTIARTESMTAVHQGQREAWAQAEDEGLLTGAERRTWIVTPDDRLCPICEPLDGAEAALDGEYPGGFEGPPAHPNCRCTEGLA